MAGADELLSEVESSGLVGRGGAAFPLAVKLRAVRDNGRRAGGAVVVANGEEGEPASIKDRWLLRNRPHLVLDGLRLAAAIVAADRAYVYVSDPESARSVETALAELGSELRRHHGRAGDGAIPDTWPARRPPRSARSTAARPSRRTSRRARSKPASLNGPRWSATSKRWPTCPTCKATARPRSARQGTPLSPGTFLATITGAGRPPVLYELPHGLPFTELLALHGISPDRVRGALMGGYFAGLLDRDSAGDHRWTTRRFAGSAAAWAAARSR